jgi:transcriptional regulator with XRE-family HTH domain
MEVRLVLMEHSDTQRRAKPLGAEDRAVAAQLRAERARVDITQVQLAERSGLAINTVRRIENEERTMSLPQLFALCRALDVEPGRFIDAAQTEANKQ